MMPNLKSAGALYFAGLELDQLPQMPAELITECCRGYLCTRRSAVDAVYAGKIVRYMQKSGRHRELDLDFDPWVRRVCSAKDKKKVSTHARMFLAIAAFEPDEVAGLRIIPRCLEALSQGPMGQGAAEKEVRCCLLVLGQGIRQHDIDGIKRLRETAVEARRRLDEGVDVAQVLAYCQAEARLPEDERLRAEVEAQIDAIGRGTRQFLTKLEKLPSEERPAYLAQFREELDLAGKSLPAQGGQKSTRVDSNGDSNGQASGREKSTRVDFWQPIVEAGIGLDIPDSLWLGDCMYDLARGGEFARHEPFLRTYQARFARRTPLPEGLFETWMGRLGQADLEARGLFALRFYRRARLHAYRENLERLGAQVEALPRGVRVLVQAELLRLGMVPPAAPQPMVQQAAAPAA